MLRKSKLFVMAAAFALTSACDSGNQVSTDDQRLRGILSQMSKLEGGSVYFKLLLNGGSTDTRYAVTGQETRIALPISDIRPGVNSIRVEFYFESTIAGEILIADSIQSIDWSRGDTITLEGLKYRYTDSDNDSIINAHELMQADADPDQDSLPNYLDADSDDDGVTDGLDFTPYGDNAGVGNNPVVSLSYRSTDGVTSQIDIGSIASDSGVLSVVAGDLSITEFVPSGWPLTGKPLAGANTLWTALEVSAGPNASCPDWRISRDTSSIRSSLSQAAYGVFQRSDDTVILTPLSDGEIADLSLYQSDNTADGADTIDNSLIAVLVTPNTAGWLTLYSQRNYAGEPCYLNGTFPRIN